MTTLAPLQTWDQFGEPQPHANDSCGPNSVASCLVAAGKLPAGAQAPLTVDAWLGNPGETTAEQLGAALAHFGSPAWHWTGALSSIDDALAAGHYAIVLVSSDSYGHPTPGTAIGHWVSVYAADAATVAIANSGSGVDESYGRAYFELCFRGVVIDTGLAPVAAPAPPAPSSPEDDSMRLTTLRTDGSTDVYVLIGTTVHHVYEGATPPVAHETLPGSYAALLTAGYAAPGAPFLRALDPNGGVWEIVFQPGTGWVNRRV